MSSLLSQEGVKVKEQLERVRVELGGVECQSARRRRVDSGDRGSRGQVQSTLRPAPLRTLLARRRQEGAM